MNKWIKSYPNLSMAIGGEDGGVCIGPAILDNPKFPPQWDPGSGPKPGLKNTNKKKNWQENYEYMDKKLKN